ncbi:MAG: ZIP family metal transporter [Bacteroidales bacterium]|jgi:zinc transporter ZupT|nr:ZIP family metal transporter [Bacteroidales bacterium]
MEQVISYLSLFIGALLGGIWILYWQKPTEKVLKLIIVFGGAFLFATCFLDLIPSIFEHALIDFNRIQPQKAFFTSFFVLLGFLINIIFEQFSHYDEHNPDLNNVKSTKSSSLLLLLALSIHAYLEGFPIYINDQPNIPMVIGIIIHNIPLSIFLVAAFRNSNFNKTQSLLLLCVFASMAILGSLTKQLVVFLGNYDTYITAFVIGILLHVCFTTLYDNNEDKKYNLQRLIIIIVAFAFVILLPDNFH